jgi:hypothetical protein
MQDPAMSASSGGAELPEKLQPWQLACNRQLRNLSKQKEKKRKREKNEGKQVSRQSKKGRKKEGGRQE